MIFNKSTSYKISQVSYMISQIPYKISQINLFPEILCKPFSYEV